MELLSVPIIASVVFAIVTLIKQPFKTNELFLKFLPLLSGVLGALFGLAAYYLAPELIPSGNVFHAILVGMFSGLSATGTHQLMKQMLPAKQSPTQNQEGNTEPAAPGEHTPVAEDPVPSGTEPENPADKQTPHDPTKK